jgi:hypothetical protein
MACSPEQLGANRRNSLKSKGPTTPEGKSKSRRNGLKHGMTGAGVVIADEDVEALDERFEAFETALKPVNDVARFLTQRAALLSVKLDRSAREEAARINLDMLEAEEVEEEARALDFEYLTNSFADHPGESVRKLRRSEEGINWLIEQWRMARLRLLGKCGNEWSVETFLHLQGRNLATSDGSRVVALCRAICGHYGRLEPSDLPAPERQAAAKAELVTIIDREIAGLEEAHKAIDPERFAKIKAGAAARAIFNASKDATLARKYEANAERMLHQTLKKIEEINTTAAETVESEEKPEAEETCGELASSLPDEIGAVERFEKPEGLDGESATRTESAKWAEARGRRDTGKVSKDKPVAAMVP